MGVLIWKDAEAPGAVTPRVSAKIRAQREAAGRNIQSGPTAPEAT